MSALWRFTPHGNAEREQKCEVFQGVSKVLGLASCVGRELSACANLQNLQSMTPQDARCSKEICLVCP